MRKIALCLLATLCSSACSASLLADEPVRRDALGDPLPADARLRLGTLRFQPPTSVIELAVSPDGERVVTIGREWLIVWDAASGKELWRASNNEGRFDLPGASYGIRALAFFPDGEHFLTPGGPGEVVKWNLKTGAQQSIKFDGSPPDADPPARMSWGRGGPRSVDISPDGERLAIGAASELVICDPQGQVFHKFPNTAREPADFDRMNRDRLWFGGEFCYALFSPDGRQLAAILSEAPTEIRLLDVATGKEVRRIKAPSNIVRMAFRPDGKQIATTHVDSSARSYVVETGEEFWDLQIQPAPRAESYTSALAYSPDGEQLAICAPIGSDYSIYVVDFASPQQTRKLTGHGWKPWAVAWAPDGQTLYSSGWAGTIQRWDPATGEELPPPAGVRASSVVAALPVAPLVAYEDSDNQIRLVRVPTGEELKQWGLADTSFEQLAFSPDGKFIAGGGMIGDEIRVAVWELDSLKLLHDWRWPKGRDEHSCVESLRFSPDSKQLAAAVFRQSSGYLWDLASGGQIAKLPHRDIYGLSFHPDGQSLVTVGWDSQLQKWDTATGELLQTVRASKDDPPLLQEPETDADSARNTFINVMPQDDLRMYTVDHSPDGRLVATGHMSAAIRIWQADGLLYLWTFPSGASFTYDALRFSPDSLWLASGLSGGSVILRDPRTGERVWNSRSHQETVYNISFGRTARELVTGSSDGVCYLWDMAPRSAASQSSNPRDPLPEVDLTGLSPVELWDALVAGGARGYAAGWKLSESPDETVALLREKLLPIKTVVDTEYLDPTLPPVQAEVRRLQSEFGLESDPTRERVTTVARALAVLQQLDTPAAAELRAGLAQRDDELGRRAQALDRR